MAYAKRSSWSGYTFKRTWTGKKEVVRYNYVYKGKTYKTFTKSR